MRIDQMKTLPIAVAMVLAAAATSAAQTGRVFVSGNVGFRPTETTFDDNVTFTANVEQGDFDAKYRTPAAPMADVRAGVRLWRQFGLGVGVSAYRKSSAAEITGRIPHPFYFSQRREVDGASEALPREETAVHLEAVWMIPVRRRIDVAIFAGPSYFNVRQRFVASLRYDESYPFDTAALTGSNSASVTGTKTGFNVGGDVSYMLTKQVGVGGVVRVSVAELEFASPDGGRVKVDAGGTHAAAGLRLRF